MSGNFYNEQQGHPSPHDLLQHFHDASADKPEIIKRSIVTGLIDAIEHNRLDWLDNMVVASGIMTTVNIKKYLNSDLNEEGHTPLIYAARLGREECLQKLVQHGADANLALARAIKEGHITAVERLLPLVDIDKINNSQKPKREIAAAIVHALHKNHRDCVVALFNHIEPENILARANFVPTTLKFLVKSESKAKLTEAKQIIQAIMQGFIYMQNSGKETLVIPQYILELATILGIKQKNTKQSH